MKNFKKYLAESKKVYSFKVKLAGNVPENFQENFKKSLEKYQIVTFEKISTPVQENPMDFPELSNKEVTIFDLVTEYPITSPEIANFVKEIGVNEECFRVRGSGEPPEYEQIVDGDGNVLLTDPFYSETAKIKHKDYFGEEFNKSFLKDLANIAKERNKELGNDKKDLDVLKSANNPKTDKAGVKSAIGS